MIPLPDKPRTVRIEVSTRCNARCLCCNRSFMQQPDNPWHLEDLDMEWSVFERAIEFVGEGTRVDLFGLGEPTLHPRLVDMVKAVSDRGADSMVSTNGILMNEDLVLRLRDAGLKGLVWSLYAPVGRLHEFLQSGVQSQMVWNNFKTSVKYGLGSAAIMVMMTYNLPEAPELVRQVADAGCKTVILQQVGFTKQTFLERVAPTYTPNIPMARHWIRVARSEASRLGVRVDRCYHPTLQ